MVVMSHAAKVLSAGADFGSSPFGLFFQFGRSGVDFFFVLSGFLISLLHWRDLGHPGRLGRYGVRRITRIYPTYWLVLIWIVPFDLFTHTLFDNYAQPSEVIKSLLLLPQRQTILDVTWSMRNELLFYALFGLAIYNRAAGLAVASVWIAGLLIRPFAVGSVDNAWLDLVTYPMNFEFLAGVLAGWVFSQGAIRRPALILGLGGALFAILWTAEDRLLLRHLPWDRFLFVCLAYGAAAASVITGLSALELSGRLRMPGPMITLGGASYLLYLVHVPALLVLGASERHLHLLRFVPGWLLALIFVALTVAGAVIAHLLVEKPMLRILRGWSEIRTDSPRAVAG